MIKLRHLLKTIPYWQDFEVYYRCTTGILCVYDSYKNPEKLLKYKNCNVKHIKAGKAEILQIEVDGEILEDKEE